MHIHGRISTCLVAPDGSRGPQLWSKPNTIMMSWGAAATRSLGFGDASYKISAAYVEFENLADPDTVITPPTFERGDTIDYYHELLYSSSRDFLRVPLIAAPTVGISTGYETQFTGEDGNVLSFWLQTQGTTGFHGKTFSAGVNSKVFGVALVATPVSGDQSKDIIVARTYYRTEDQILKPVGASQVGVTWDLTFE